MSRQSGRHPYLLVWLFLLLASLACSITIDPFGVGPIPATIPAGPPSSTPAAIPPTISPATLTPTGVPATATSTAVPPTSVPTLTVDQLKNATIQITGISDTNKTRTIQLSDGQFVSGPDRAAAGYVSVNMGSQVAFGDLNGDGAPDAAIIVGENTGGSGDFVSVAALLNQAGQPVFAGSSGIDDRPKINSLAIQNGEIQLDTLVHGPNDPGCCAALPETRALRLWSGGLVLTRVTTTIPDGTRRIIKIDSPAPGSEVSGPFTVSGSVTVAPFEDNLAYAVFLEGTPDPVVRSAIMVSAANPGGPGTFQLPLDFSAAGIKGNIRIEISDLSAADGSYLALDTLFVTVK